MCKNRHVPKCPNGVTYYLEAINEGGKTLSNKQMIKVPTGTIPDIKGLKDAINKKWNTNSAPNDSNVPRMYVQDVKNNHVPNNMVSQDESGVKGEKQERKVGLVMNDAADELDKGIRTNIQTFAERTGSTVVVEHGLVDEKGETIMGDEKDGVIRINADYADAAHSITVHEFTHRMQNIAPKASENFKNYVVSKMKNEGTYESAMAKLREDYQGLSDEKLIDELCAETAERLFRDEAELTDFIKKDRTLAEWVKDVWLNVLDMLGRTDERTHAQLMWKKCVNEATRAKDKGVTTDEVRYSRPKNEIVNKNKKIFSVEEKILQSFSNRIEEYKNDKNKLEFLLKLSSRTPEIISEIQRLKDKLRGEIAICKTPFLLTCLGAGNVEVSISTSVINKATEGVDLAHSISIESLKSLPSELADPIMVFESEKNENNNQRSLVVITSITNEIGHEAIVILQINKRKGFARINDIASVYSKTDDKGINRIGDFIEKQLNMGNLRYIDKDKSDRWLRTSRLQLPTVNTIIASNNNILQKKDIVNMYSMQNGGNNSDSSQKRPGVSEKLDEYINKFGEMEKGKGPRRDVSVPKRTAENNRVRQFARTAAEATTLSEETSEGVLENVAEGKLSYVPISNKRAMDYAYSTLDAMGFEWVEKKVNGAIANHSFDKNTVAMAEVLLQSYDEMGDQERAQQLIVDFAAEATRMGQSIQAISMLKKLDKNYEVIYIDKIVENLKEEIIERNEKWYRWNKTDADSIEVSEDLKNALREAKTEAEREAIREYKMCKNRHVPIKGIFTSRQLTKRSENHSGFNSS